MGRQIRAGGIPSIATVPWPRVTATWLDHDGDGYRLAEHWPPPTS